MTSSGTETAGPAVVVKDLKIRYGSVEAVKGVSFEADYGAITVLLGPNGAGKTSIVEHLEGYRHSDGGSSAVMGLDPIGDHRQLSESVGIMLQNGGIPTAIRPLELLAQYAGFFDGHLNPTELLELVGLSGVSRSHYRRLSGGEQQRLSLALALIGRPRVVFLDEPTAGVDLTGRDLTRQVILGLRDDGVCVIVTTHDLAEAESIADKVVIIDHGTVVADGSPAELVSSPPSDALLFATSGTLDLAALSTHLGRPVVEVSHGEYRVDADPDPRLVAALTAWLADNELTLLDLRANRQRLDDVFRRLTTITSDEDSESTGDVPTQPSRRGRSRRR